MGTDTVRGYRAGNIADALSVVSTNSSDGSIVDLTDR
jgi:hypothetical protein